MAAYGALWQQSETFYRPQPELNADASAEGSSGPARQFIQTALVGHKMWRSLSFWEEAFYRSIREEVKKTYGRQLAASGGADGAAARDELVLSKERDRCTEFGSLL